MRAYSTADIPLEELHKLSDELGPHFQMQVDEGEMFHKGGISPSWVMFFAHPDWLTQMLELSAGLYVAEIIKEAGKDTWKNRKKIASATGDRRGVRALPFPRSWRSCNRKSWVAAVWQPEFTFRFFPMHRSKSRGWTEIH